MNVADIITWLLAGASGAALTVLLARAFFLQPVDHGRDWFLPMDVVTAFAISALLGTLAVLSFAMAPIPLSRQIVQGGMVQQLVLGGMVLLYLLTRRIPLGDFLGFQKMGVLKSVLLAAGLIVAFSPLISMVANLLNPGGNNDQAVVTFFRERATLQDRVWVIGLAVFVAPVCEELVFRGFLYGIFQKYFGKIAAMFFTSVLFAAIHGHLPILLPLTLFAVGLTIGLELSGSMAVPIIMHALFNGVTLLILMVSPAS